MEEKIVELTTQEIFEQSMKLSEPAYQKKGEKLIEYREWLSKKWTSTRELHKLLHEIKSDCKEENTRYKKGWDDAINLLALELQKEEPFKEEPQFHYDFYDEKGLTARGEDKLREDREAREK